MIYYTYICNMNKITKEELEKFLEDNSTQKSDREFKIYVPALIDEDGNIKCGFLEMFDQAMKDALKDYGN